MNNLRLPIGRTRLAAVMRTAGDVVRIGGASRTLGITRQQAAKLLSRWAQQGWLKRVGVGVYVPVQVDLLDSEQVVQDAWMLVPALFAPAYIGGRTAAEHWDLTEQLFRDVVVFTARPGRRRVVKRQGGVFTLKHIREEMIFGTKTVWRGRTRVAVSDVHRTIVDMLDDPAVGGGIQHVADCLDRYMKHGDCDTTQLIAHARRRGNGAVFKRLGFLAERHARGGILAEEVKAHLSKGHAVLDPALACDRLVTRWRLRVPEGF